MEPAVVTRPALAAELRAIAWPPVVAAAGASGLLLVLDATVWPNGPGAVTAWLGVTLLTGAACFALDQPAEDVVRSSPTTRAWRTAVRAGGGLVVLAVWAAYAVWWRSQLTFAVPSWWAQGLVGLSLVVLGLGLCAALVRRGRSEPAATVSGGLVFAVLALGLVPVPGDVQTLDLSGTRGSTTAFWVVVGAVGAVGLVWGSRDEGSRWRGPHTGPAVHR
ncbi:hypothetical protein LL946_12060 [Knoellia locipacati]|uniref:hypothetical protein n=1 Tax=Knoellia locipacati TaxID=882824 RepID=UPI003850EB1D